MFETTKGFIGYTIDCADDFFENELKEEIQEFGDAWAKPGLELAETLVNLKIIKETDECPDGLEKKFEQITDEMEDKMGIKFEEIAEFEDSVENFKIVGKHFFKVMLPVLWRERKSFYFIRKLVFKSIRYGIFRSVITMLNPKTWYGFWKGYLGQL